MQFKGFLKRILPFLLTFSVSLLVASFFVTVAAPSFNFKPRKHRCREYRENIRLRVENERLQHENEVIRRQLLESESRAAYRKKPALSADLVPPPPPLPPVAPRAVR